MNDEPATQMARQPSTTGNPKSVTRSHTAAFVDADHEVVAALEVDSLTFS